MKEKRCEVEVFSRVTGFFRPVQSWNEGKVSEFKDRKKFEVKPFGTGQADEYCGITETVTG